MPAEQTPDSVLDFWFEEITPERWWEATDSFDRQIESRFGALHRAAARCELYGWRGAPRGRLAEIIVLDQFSRNIHRGHAEAFAFDALALALAQTAVAARADRELPAIQRAFLYMPYMHSESLIVHQEAIALFSEPGLEKNLKSARQHKEILERFGRYPHRNAILGRPSTPEETDFLTMPGSSF